MDFRVGSSDEEYAPWSVLSDISITMVLFLVIFIVMQFLQTYRERSIQTVLHDNQQLVKRAIEATAGSNVVIDSLSPERQRITFSDATLFEVCRSNLKSDGESLLRRVGAVLNANRHLLETVSVEGHTDTIPTTGRAGCNFASNWELSSARATTVVSLWSVASLIGNGKMSAIGRSQYMPVDVSDMGKNRRIEVILQYDRTVAAAQVGREPR